ncbi:MAG: 4-hydroxybutyrate--acetyl-CoA CoA transferase [Bacteroidetes bacterium]|nr:4-hydroxybutyrate--acetyl-CoA CoA transferase [Bacteroidota bacterium]
MDYQEKYHLKLTTPDEAVKVITHKGNMSFGMAVAQPPALLKAVADRARNGGFEELKVYYLHSEQPAQETILQYDLMDVIKPHPGFMCKAEKLLLEQGRKEGRKVVDYVPNSFSQMPRYLTENIAIDTFIVTVSPMDKSGYFSLGTGNDYGSTVARACKHLIVEVNENMPRVFGGSQIHVSEVESIVENNLPLVEMVPRPPKPEDEKIGEQIAKMIPDRAVIQMGIGGVPDAVCRYLQHHKDLGIHSELLSPGMATLIKQGIVTGKYKQTNPGKHVFTLAFGDKEMYEFMNDNPSMESYAVSYVNDPAVIAQNDNVISVNSILNIDLFGQVNAEYMNGHQFGGSGGQNDFVRGAYMSKGGKSIIAFESSTKGGTISKVVPKLDGIVTDLRLDTQYVVTEYGSINLKGLSTSERALGLIGLAHPDFRDELLQQAKEMQLVGS